ncbi:MAG: hypothetical protein ACKO6N_22950 [Myxococcota bacterium]
MTDLEILRVVLARELDTINEYAALARQATDPAVRTLLEHIGRDEEEHVAECIQWMARLNPTLAGYLARQPEHILGATAGVLGATAGAVPTPPAPPHATSPVVRSGPRPPAAPRGALEHLLPGAQLVSRQGLTVGPLVRRPQPDE